MFSTSILPLIFVAHYRHLIHYVEPVYEAFDVFCDTSYSGIAKFTYGGYYQDIDDKCIVYQLDNKECEVPYGCANLQREVLDHTWYGSKAVVCDGINVNKKFEYLPNITVNIQKQVTVSCRDPYGFTIDIFENTKHFKIYNMFLPAWYSAVLSRHATTDMYDIDSSWQHIRVLRLPKLSVIKRLKTVRQPNSPFIFINVKDKVFTYSCGVRRLVDFNLRASRCGPLLPINFTHGVCSDTVLRFDPDRCFDDYNIKLLPADYVISKFIKAKPTGFFATIAAEIVDAIIYVVKPLVEDVLQAVLMLLSKLLITLKDILHDILPLILDVLNEVVDILDDMLRNLIKFIDRLLQFLIKMLKMLDEKFILTEITVSYILAGLRFGAFRAFLLILILLYFIGLQRDKLDLRDKFYPVN